jgi:hypothetical protein
MEMSDVANLAHSMKITLLRNVLMINKFAGGGPMPSG